MYCVVLSHNLNHGKYAVHVLDYDIASTMRLDLVETSLYACLVPLVTACTSTEAATHGGNERTCASFD